jgi:hypothetical protein
MGDFKLVHVLSPNKSQRSLPSMFLRLDMADEPNWLISYPKLLGSFEPAKYFNIDRDDIRRIFCFDSGGASDRTGAVHRALLVPANIANKYLEGNPRIGFSPDLPPSYYSDEDFNETLSNYAERIDEFYGAVEDFGDTMIYEVIHGSNIYADRFSLKQRLKWFEKVHRKAKDRYSGLAMPGLINVPFKILAFFALLPWSLGVEKCHILGVGKPQSIALLVYIAHHGNLSMSCDCKTFTIDAINYGRAHFINEREFLTALPADSPKLVHRYLKIRTQNPIWKYYEARHGASICDLAKQVQEAKNAGLPTNRNRLDEWVAAGNVFATQAFVSKLKSKVSNRKEYCDFLLGAGCKRDIVDAIDFADAIIKATPKKYRSHLKHLNRSFKMEGSKIVKL